MCNVYVQANARLGSTAPHVKGLAMMAAVAIIASRRQEAFEIVLLRPGGSILMIVVKTDRRAAL